MKELDCSKVHSLLSDYIDSRLTGNERAAVEAHLKTCQECAEELGSLRETVALLHRLEELPVPRSFAIPEPARGQAALPRQGGGWRLWPRGWPAFAYLRLATAATAAIFVAIIAMTMVAVPVSAPSASRAVTRPAAAPEAQDSTSQSASVTPTPGAPMLRAAPAGGAVPPASSPQPEAAAAPPAPGGAAAGAVTPEADGKSSTIGAGNASPPASPPSSAEPARLPTAVAGASEAAKQPASAEAAQVAPRAYSLVPYAAALGGLVLALAVITTLVWLVGRSDRPQ